MLLPEDIVNNLRDLIGDDVLNWDLQIRYDGFKNKREQKHLAIKVEREAFHRTVVFLRKLSPLHISCPMAHIETDDSLEIIYPFTIYAGHGDFTEQPVLVSYDIPKNDLRTRSIADIFPGIVIMEREAQEMLGITIEDIPDGRRFFTPNNLEEGYFPLRNDNAKIDEDGVNE